MKEWKFDYRKPEKLKRYLDDFGRIKPRWKTGLSPKEQHEMTQAAKRAKHLVLLQLIMIFRMSKEENYVGFEREILRKCGCAFEERD